MPFDPDAFIKATSGKEFDPDAFAAANAVPGDQQRAPIGADAGPEARRAASGLPPGPRTDAPPETDSGPLVDVSSDPKLGRLGVNPNPRLVPLAQVPADRQQSTAEMGAVLPMLAAPGVGGLVRGAAPALGTRVLAGALEGAIAGVGISPGAMATGAGVGAALPLAGAGIARLFAGAGAAKDALFLRLGRSATGADRTELQKLGAKGLDEALDAAGVRGSPDPQAAITAARTKAEGELRTALTARNAAAEAAVPPHERLFQALGESATPTQRARLAQFDAKELYDVAQKNGLTTGPDPRVGVATALNKVGGEINTAYQATDAAGKVDLGRVMDRLEAVEKQFAGKAGTRDVAPAVAKLRETLADIPEHGQPWQITARQLKDEITAINQSGFGGNILDPTLKKQADKQVAAALQGVLDEHFADLAKANPAAAGAVKEIGALNREYRILKTVEPIYAKKGVAARFAAPEAAAGPVPIDKHLDELAATSPELAAQVKQYRALSTVGKVVDRLAADRAFAESTAARFAKAPVKTTVGAAADVAGRVTGQFGRDVALARLFAARAAGQITPEAIKAAADAGVDASILASFRRQPMEAR